MLFRFLCVVAVVGVLGCSSRNRTGFSTDDASVDAAVDAVPDALLRPDRVIPDASTGRVLIYAHSRDTLFTFSAETLQVEPVGVFQLADGGDAPFMLDLAVDAEGEVFTVSNDTLFSVNTDTAVVTPIGVYDVGGDRLFALSFLAPGELEANEVLVGATNEGAYYRLDRTTAEVAFLGNYPDGWGSSGDIVSVTGLGTFATVRRDDFPSDVLVRMIFSSDGSSIATVIGPIRGSGTDYVQLFGLGFWGTELFGFSNAGELISIDVNSGAASVATANTGTMQFWGAGVTTVAPVLL
ncbi:MAG: hypothetical protein AAGF12_23990 [Myxococcota bacterium]